ncbi:hypothetical protein Xaut_4519 [Xanthobacter versatilis]|uniref:Uncharacterized protein n=1 Tax=Xanthobacter autotrophicus (strain ATCC BAA-1158 / Py2) TaxID=78245 RepID=A7INZ4_XANP2|nr:hypothetical protein Xaut_4519 [Xanthobacter autotrophicus Py2]
MATTNGPTPTHTELELAEDYCQVAITLTFATDEEAELVFDKMAASIKANLLEIKAVQPRSPIDNDRGAE